MTNDSVKPPVWFWIVSVIALIWNGMGVMNYLARAYMTEEALAALPEAQQAQFAPVPAWVTAAFAIAVFGGTLGSILLLLRKKLAYMTLVISLAGILVQMFHGLFLMDNAEGFGTGGITLMITIIVFGVGLVFLAKKGKEKGWLS